MSSLRSSLPPGRPAAVALALALGSVAAGCSLLIGDLAECSSDADCSDGLVCAESFCVLSHAGSGGSGGVPGCRPLGLAEGEANPVMVGILVFLTSSDGTPEANGTVTLHAAQLGLEELNSRQGTGTRLFDAFACDTHGDAATARAQAQALAAAGVAAIVGPDSSRELLAVASETTPAGTLLISPSATSPEITFLADKQHPDDAAGLVWRTAPSDALQGAVLARMLGATPPAPSVSGIVLDDPYGDGLWSVFEGAYSGPMQRELYRREEDVAAAVANAADFGPGLVMIVAFPSDAVKIVDAMAATPALAAVPLVFSDSARSTDLFLVQEPARLEGARGTAPASPRGPEFQSFLSRYNARFPEDPTQFALIEHAYDAAYLVGLGASWAAGPTGEGEVTGPRIAEGLTHVSSPAAEPLSLQPGNLVQARSELQAGREINVTGASGLLDFDGATGEAPSPIEEWVVRNGAFETVVFHDPP